MVDVNEKGFTKLFNNAIEKLDAIIMADELSDEDKIKVKVCQSVIGAYPRFRQAQADIARVTISVIKETSETEEQYREIIRATLPRISPLLSLPQIIDTNRQTVTDMGKKVSDITSKLVSERDAWSKERNELQFKILQLEEKSISK